MAPRPFLEDSWGGSWDVLGGLGPLLGALGPSSDGLGAILRASDHKIENQVENCQTPFAFWVDFGSQNGSQNDPKTIQNESKIKTKNASLFSRSWTRLGPVLRRSWARLGVRKVIFALALQWFRENRRFRKKDDSRLILGPTWPDLGSQMGSKRSPRRAQNGTKTSPKSSPKSKRKNDRKMDGPGLHATLWPSHFLTPRARRGEFGGGSIHQPRTPP